MHNILTIVVAGGSGRRMGGGVPKQFLELGGEPVVMRSLRRLAEGVERFLTLCSWGVDEEVDKSADPKNCKHPFVENVQCAGWNVDNFVHKIVLVLPEAHLELWRELCERYDFRLPHTVAAGGESRFHSVRNGLRAVPEADLVLVHDGVRPFVDDRTIAAVLEAAHRYGAAVPTVPVVDSLRRIDPCDPVRSEAVDRSAYRAVQTPQGFRGEWLRRAYAAPYDDRFTDDASVVELTGVGRVVLTDGDPANLKITTPTDLVWAETWLRG
ncbi:MAG: 2-C-methyl-D-erythritol 4-phosphate cytidylyltransferase [Rikenella sp.]|nr:2-C-methyl-D-erythritol 4-phosphate cytidylyltransferase [Rikenella sp.]